MFQPEVKCAFVSRYCPPEAGWWVYVDIDASELGETGGERRTAAAIGRQKIMQCEGRQAMQKLKALGATVRGPRAPWFASLKAAHPQFSELAVPGDRDIVAVHPEERRLIVAEVEGVSAGQPETKLYKAIGQAVMAVSETKTGGLDASFIVVVHGEKIGDHLCRATVLERLGITGLQIAREAEQDQWLIGGAFGSGDG